MSGWNTSKRRQQGCWVPFRQLICEALPIAFNPATFYIPDSAPTLTKFGGPTGKVFAHLNLLCFRKMNSYDSGITATSFRLRYDATSPFSVGFDATSRDI
jgi:hypothetical protein